MDIKGRILRLNGVFAVNKPAGESSARTVERVKHALFSMIKGPEGARLPSKDFAQLKKQIKVGHGGTLDPLATGVLVIGLGSGCKQLQSFLQGTLKGYRAVGRFGAEYDTYDREGVVVKETAWDHITKEMINETLKEKFTGDIMQVPPLFSALHINGQRAYDIARKRQRTLLLQDDDKRAKISEAKAVEEEDEDAKVKEGGVPDPGTQPRGEAEGAPEMKARPVTIHHVGLLRFEAPEFELEMEVGSGTYVRSLIHDLGRELGSAAAMFELVRTKQGSFVLHDCLSISDLDDLERLEKALKTK